MLHSYPSRESLAEALSAGVAAVLAGGLATRGAATLAVSGGSTPTLFLDRLSQMDIDWSGVSVTLVDERCVPETSERSNAAFVRRHLLKGPAGAARFEPLYRPEIGDGGLADAVADAKVRIGGMTPSFDAVVLGMGADGHTASFFPGGNTLDAALDPENPDPVIGIEAPGAGEPRITLTLPRIVSAHFLALHIEGRDKRAVYMAALGDGPCHELPVRAVLRTPRDMPLEIFWAPLPSDEALSRG